MEEKNNRTMIWDKKIKYTAPEKEDLERTRDMFAKVAMRYYLEYWYHRNFTIKEDIKAHKTPMETTKEQISQWSYDFADAMIKEKQRRRNICNVDETKDK